jgi:membrane-anchored protein YejM (alkaline phosphatase superfamily)
MESFGASEEKSVLTNAAVLPNVWLAMLTSRSAAIQAATTEEAHIQEYRNGMARTHALIENDQIRFVFLHLIAPHPPGIYDRQHHMLRRGGTYLDNLVLADDTLGALLQQIDATPSASRTTVIVSSDHSWRIPLWRPTPGWSAEEERVSGGRFDDRPVLLIHFPGQNSGDEVNAALPELLEHDIIAEMLRGKINNSEDLAGFLTEHGR